MFVIKMLIVTVIATLILQVRWGNTTLEEATMDWIRNSTYTVYLQDAADGGVIVIQEVMKKVSASFDRKFKDGVDAIQEPGVRAVKAQISRSQKFLQEQAQRAENYVDEAHSTMTEAQQEPQHENEN